MKLKLKKEKRKTKKKTAKKIQNQTTKKENASTDETKLHDTKILQTDSR